MTQSAFRFFPCCQRYRIKTRIKGSITYKHQRARMCVQCHAAIHCLERPIRLHPSRMHKVACCETASYLFCFVRASDCQNALGAQRLVHVDAKALHVSLELIPYTDSSRHAFEVQVMAATPRSILFALGDKCLIHIEQCEMIAFCNCKLPS